MDKFVKEKKEYDVWVCKNCGKTDTVATIKSLKGEILLCLECLSVERKEAVDAPKV